jgi:N-dimethylarginine dimethylaminohydrolase
LKRGVDELQKAFSDIPVTAISVREGLHLKSSMTMLCDNTILIGKSSASQFIKEQIKAKSKYADTYKYVEVEQDEHGAANVLYFNGCTLYPKSFESIYNQLNEFKELKSVKSLENSEVF